MATYYPELKTSQETQSQQYLKADDGGLENYDVWYDDPYAVGVLVTSCTFLITFRINFSYQRYWSAAGAVHDMMSRWMAAATQTAGFHMQSAMYDRVKPPSFNDHPDMTYTSLRDIHYKRNMRPTMSNNSLAARSINDFPTDSKLNIFNPRAFRTVRSKKLSPPQSLADIESFGSSCSGPLQNLSEFTSDKPSPFLQELVHQFSLLNAVALATLRSDADGAPSPLTGYAPGSPWPEVEPVNILNPEKKAYSCGACSDLFLYILGVDRSTLSRTKYNASRPIGVYGGISDTEIKQLQAARGPCAKVALCSRWLEEFVVREHLSGSLGKVGPPIVSFLFAYLSDGMAGYNQARNIMWIPFPFPHAQIAVLFSWVLVLCVPLLLFQYEKNYDWMGAFLTFLTVLSLISMHEVAKELENPFRNTPNDLPLCTMQAQFNEAMMTMFAGYHPESWWDPPSLQCKETGGNTMDELQTVKEFNDACAGVQQP
eukprot:CAMPEP_0194315640 /NCGR_PEP_ID=MMETSP0171-20130528/12441_1 /TAXON_ID=218684 /ORGANISM="Corethron pennatum, Strain L29A3" /LENGTH=483 /DNA_ID=CAMNT_0039071531 /DNA_START=407 /DNA_END=1855 /DNA_ORIENTATION=+